MQKQPKPCMARITMTDTYGNVFLQIMSVVPGALLAAKDGTELKEQNYMMANAMTVTFTRVTRIAVM